MLEGIHDNCYIDTLPVDVLTYLLGFAWNCTYRLALVSKRFLSITRGRAFWRLLGQHALKNDFSDFILKDVNFFWDLKEEDHPHTWLWGLISPIERRSYHIDRRVSVTFRRKDSNECFRILKPSKKTRSRYYLLRYSSNSKYLAIQPLNLVKRVCFNSKHRFSEVYMYLDGIPRKVITLYVEYWDSIQQKYWCGAIADAIDSNPVVARYWVPLEGFGMWKDD